MAIGKSVLILTVAVSEWGRVVISLAAIGNRQRVCNTATTKHFIIPNIKTTK